MAELTTKQQNALPNSAFCGPDRTYPVLKASDIQGVASLLGKAPASQQADIKASALAKAKRFGWPIPDSWKEH